MRRKIYASKEMKRLKIEGAIKSLKFIFGKGKKDRFLENKELQDR